MPDRIMRRSLEVPANLHDFLRNAAPHLAEGFNYAAMRPVNRETFTADWRIREADLLLEVPFRDPAAPLPGLVCVLMEHQSDTDRVMPLRMLLGMTGYWERRWHAWQALPAPRPRLLLPPVLPILLYTGELPWGSARTITDMLAEPQAFHLFAPGWGPVFWELSERPLEQLLAGGGFLQVLAVMRATWEDQAGFERIYAGAMNGLGQLQGHDEARWRDLLEFALAYALWRRPIGERPRLVEIAAANQPGREGEVRVMVQTIAEAYLDEGRTEGRVEEARNFLRMILEGRFGPLPEALRLEIAAMQNLERLRVAGQQALHVTSLAEFRL
jgi:hypothetical protein